VARSPRPSLTGVSPPGSSRAAIELAERALRLTRDDAAVIDTLAAAYASAGRFAEAAQAAQRAHSLASQAGEAALAAEIGRRLALYRRGLPYVER